MKLQSGLSDIQRLLDATEDVDDRRAHLADLLSWVEGALAELESEEFEELDEVR